MKEGTALHRCAVYTRKSSEEGLDQSFNSLQAQREACEAYILSQRHEGWKLVPTSYDDGGFSGGNMERPGLKRLLHDIDSGKVDIVVVYKVDRLTRSLADFAKMVEIFDTKKASFVSVTQQFNTTSSMGRLTLNVLLSFAQFEREVTGERIRDKFAASKRKGMWMGGTLPFGYDLGDRCLIVNDGEAEQVRHIFEMYLKFKSVFELYDYLKKKGYRSKRRQKGGGAIFSRGVLYHLLNNPLYIGKVRHKGQLHKGQHKAIISQGLWDGVSKLLEANRKQRKVSKNTTSTQLLTGILQTEHGKLYTPTYSMKQGKRFSYYIVREDGIDTHRLPSNEIDRAAADSLRELLLNSLDLSSHFGSHSLGDLRLLTSAARHRSEQLLQLESTDIRTFVREVVERVIVQKDELIIQCDRSALAASLLGRASESIDDEPIRMTQPFLMKRRGGGVRLVLQNTPNREGQPIASLVRAISQSRQWSEEILRGEYTSMNQLAKAKGVSWLYASRVLRCAALSPQHVQTILEGRQPPELTFERLSFQLPLSWNTQILSHHSVEELSKFAQYKGAASATLRISDRKS